MGETVQKKIKMKMLKAAVKGMDAKDYIESLDIDIKKVSKDSLFLGEVFVDDRIYGLLGLEKEFWSDESTPSDLEYLDRIALKLYDAKGKSVGVIEERLVKELTQSIVSGTLPVFTAILKGSPYIIDIEKESNKLVFPLLVNKSKGFFDIFQISKKALAIGADFTVERKIGDEKVAFIDSKRGGKIEIEIYDDELADTKDFVNVLTLFAGTIQFHEDIANKIKSTVEALSQGALVLKPSRKALELMQDPRKAKRPKKETEEERKETRKRRKKRKIRGVDEEEEEEKPKKLKKGVKKRSLKSRKTQKGYKALYLADPVKKATGVGKKTADLLNEVGIITVEDFIGADPKELAGVLKEKSITPTKINKWQVDSQKRVRATLEDDETGLDAEVSDYELLDYDM